LNPVTQLFFFSFFVILPLFSLSLSLCTLAWSDLAIVFFFFTYLSFVIQQIHVKKETLWRNGDEEHR